MSLHPGLELVLILVRAEAAGRRCAACGRSLAEAAVEPGEVDPERVVARLVCACGAAEEVEVRPSREGGRAEVR